MIVINGNCIEKEVYYNYFSLIVSKIYKILPLKEEFSETYKEYIDSLQSELLGNKELIWFLREDSSYLSIIATMQYLINEDYTAKKCKKEVFKCIKIIEKIQEKYFK
jgi:hypothetical protein